MKRPALAAVACLAITTALAADPLPRATPDSVGMSSQRLGRIALVINADVAAGRLPGAVIAIARKGKLVYFESFGYLDKAGEIPMPKDAIFRIASMTKPLVGVGTMMLVEEGRMFLSDPVGRHLPSLAKLQVAVVRKDASGNETVEMEPAKRQPTIQDLLRHTSGITYGYSGNTSVHKNYPLSSTVSSITYTGAEFIEKMSSLPLLNHPGTEWDYGLSTDVLGLAMEAITKQSLGEFLDARLFKPLGMKDSGFIVPPDKAARYAKALPNDPDTGKPQSVPDSTKPGKFECGGGCVASTAADYLRFAQMMLNRGRLEDRQILGRKSVELMTADHLGPEVRTEMPGYGFGLTMAVRRQAGISASLGSEGEYTWFGAFGTHFWVDPKEQLVVVFMAHIPGPIGGHYNRVIKSLVLQALVD